MSENQKKYSPSDLAQMGGFIQVISEAVELAKNPEKVEEFLVETLRTGALLEQAKQIEADRQKLISDQEAFKVGQDALEKDKADFEIRNEALKTAEANNAETVKGLVEREGKVSLREDTCDETEKRQEQHRDILKGKYVEVADREKVADDKAQKADEIINTYNTKLKGLAIVESAN